MGSALFYVPVMAGLHCRAPAKAGDYNMAIIEAETAKAESLRRRDAAAEYVRTQWGIPCSPKTLAKLAVTGGGPVFRKAGRTPLYPQDGLDAWASGKLGPRIRSSSENEAARGV